MSHDLESLIQFARLYMAKPASAWRKDLVVNSMAIFLRFGDLPLET